MDHTELSHHDFGTGEKKLTIYTAGMIACVLLTILSFWVVMSHQLTKRQIIFIIFASACIQFLVQVFCFLRLNTATPQGRLNVMILLFTFAVLFCIVLGSVWIMLNLHYNMM
jgi:cytochrome o ubiquinol oxidase operon protein cyoD